MRPAAYNRVSTQEQVDHGWNLDEDQRLAKELADEKGWGQVELFDDGGLQGDDADRPNLRRLLDSLDEYTHLIVRDMDRYARHLPTYLDLRERVKQTGVEVWEFTNPRGPVQFDLADGLKAVIAEDEKRKIGRRVKQAMAGRARAGLLPAGVPRYGYGWLDKKLTVVAAEADVVRRMFREHNSGRGQRQIIRALNEDGLRPRSGAEWHQSAVSKILRDPIYTGKLRWKGEVVDGQKEAIIDDATWAKAEAIRDSKGRKGGRRPDAAHLFTGKTLRCTCGSALVPRKGGELEGRDRYICLGRREHGAEFCSVTSLRRELIDEPFLNELVRDFIDLEATENRIAERISEALELAHTAEAQAEAEVLRINDSTARIKRDYKNGGLTLAEWREFEAELADELQGAEAAHEQARAHRQAIEREGVRDAQTELLERLAALRWAVAGDVSSAPDIHALRNLIVQTFESVQLIKCRRTDGGYVIEAPAEAAGTRLPHLDKWIEQGQPAFHDGDVCFMLWPALRGSAVDQETGDVLLKELPAQPIPPPRRVTIPIGRSRPARAR